MMSLERIRLVIPVSLIMTAIILVQLALQTNVYMDRLENVRTLVFYRSDINQSGSRLSCPIKDMEVLTWSANQTKTNKTRKNERETSCKLRTIGGQQKTNYGAWKLCETESLLASKNTNASQGAALVYSFGLGTDTSFDEDMIKRYGAVVHGFDPTPGALSYARGRAASLPDCFFALHPFGLNHKDGEIDLYPPANPSHISHNQLPRPGARPVAATLLRLATIMHLLGHARVHILKMDVEGAEFSVLDALLSPPPPPLGEAGPGGGHAPPAASAGDGELPFDQLCVEYHPGLHPGGPAAGAAAIKRITAALRARGLSLVASNGAHEYSYARLADAGPGSR